MDNYYYTYVYCDPRKPGLWYYKNIILFYKPFYIGKGQGSRIEYHCNPSALKSKSLKNSIIKAILQETSKNPMYHVLFKDLTEESAFTLEKDIISYFGRQDNLTGILANHTEGGEGSTGFIKVKSNHELKVYQYDLNGSLVDIWNSLNQCESLTKIQAVNIAGSIKRKGTCNGFVWSYAPLVFDCTVVRYQMPIKYTNIKQIDIITKEVVATYKDALDVELKLQLRSGARNKILECVKGNIRSYKNYEWKI